MLYIRTIKEYQLPAQRNFNARQYLHRNLEEQQNLLWSTHALACSAPEADVLELNDRFLLEIALPGVVLDDVEIKAEDRFITIEAKRLPAPFEQGAYILHQELPVGRIVRHFEFSMPILAEQVEARLDRGILFVSVPKLEIAHNVPVLAGSLELRMPGVKTQIVSKSDTVRSSGKEVAVK